MMMSVKEFGLCKMHIGALSGSLGSDLHIVYIGQKALNLRILKIRLINLILGDFYINYSEQTRGSLTKTESLAFSVLYYAGHAHLSSD